MANETGTESTNVQWTPELKIQRLKEWVTTLIGLLIVVCTLFLAIKTFMLAGKAEITDAKDILQVLLGVAGVVVGYYFGRVPADAHAAKAQEQANEANAHAEQVSVQAQELADQLDQVSDKMAPTGGATRGMEPSNDSLAKDLQTIRDKLRSVAARSRKN